MISASKLLLLVSLTALVSCYSLQSQLGVAPNLNIYYCGFGGNFCGESFNDDVYARASVVILAFADIASNGELIVDSANFPKKEVNGWRNTGKKVMLSVGGHKSDWSFAYSSESNRQNFLRTATDAVRTYNLDGIDFDIESNYQAAPRAVANTIIDLKRQLNNLGRKYISVSPDCVAVYQGVAVPDPDKGGQPFNYLVNIIKLADSSIDYYQPKAYSNWESGFPGGTLNYFQDVYLNWRNYKALCDGCIPIPNFSGVAASKLVMGVLASPDARTPEFYAAPQVIRDLKNWLYGKGYDMYGFNVWNSYWDVRNGNQISAAATA